MTLRIVYPYYVEHCDKAYVLLWEPTKGGDQFITREDGSVLVGRNKRELERAIKERHLDVVWNESTSFDSREFSKKLRGLREGRASSSRTCNVLLEGWNLTDDLLRTVSREDLLKVSRSRVLKKAYQKLFYGINLEPVTPAGASYSPLWGKAEIESMRDYMQKSWHALSEVFPK